MFFKIGVLKNLANLTGKHLHWSLFLEKFQAFRLQHRWFPVKFVKFIRTPFLQKAFSGYSSEEKVSSKKKTF